MDELKRRLTWACRRGMLELDLYLQPFIANAFQDLSTEEQQLFEDLLSNEDQDLLAWLMEGPGQSHAPEFGGAMQANNKKPAPIKFEALIKRIRDYAVTN